MMTNRAYHLLLVLLFTFCVGSAAWLDRWFMCWPGNRTARVSPLNVAIGDGQKLFSTHFYRKADAYFHSGFYPTIYDNQESFKTAHMAADAGAAASKNEGDETAFMGKPLDIFDRFSRNFLPARHTHLDKGGATGPAGDLGEDKAGTVREILPWLRLSASLDPEVPETYTVTAYWLRERMGKVDEAEQFLREGLKAIPGNCALLYELGRIYDENRNDKSRARNIWEAALKNWREQESSKKEPDKFILDQIATHLARLEEGQTNLTKAIAYLEMARQVSPASNAVQIKIDELRQKPGAEKNSNPSPKQP